MGRWRNCHIYRQSRRAKFKCDIEEAVEAIYQIRVRRSSRTLGRAVYMAARRCGSSAVLLESLRRCRAAGKSADSGIQGVSRWETPVCQFERLMFNNYHDGLDFQRNHIPDTLFRTNNARFATLFRTNQAGQYIFSNVSIKCIRFTVDNIWITDIDFPNKSLIL